MEGRITQLEKIIKDNQAKEEVKLGILSKVFGCIFSFMCILLIILIVILVKGVGPSKPTPWDPNTIVYNTTTFNENL